MHSRVAAICGLALVAVIAFPGCSSSPQPGEVPWLPHTFDELYEQALEDARATDASDALLELLDEAREEGEVTFEIARSATMNVVECLNQSGLEARYSERVEHGGVVYPAFTAAAPDAMSDEQSSAVISWCEDREFEPINRLYQLQPSVRLLHVDYIMRQESQLRTCLATVGHEFESSLNGWEVAAEALDRAQGDQVLPVLECLDEVGITGL